MSEKELYVRGMLKIWLLFFLNKKPMSGYELMKKVEEFTGGKVVLKPGAVYPMLRKLVKEGLIEVVGKGKRNKSVYRITKEGGKFLRDVRRKVKERLRKREITDAIGYFLWPKEDKELREAFSRVYLLLFELRDSRSIGKDKVLSVLKKITKILESTKSRTSR